MGNVIVIIVLVLILSAVIFNMIKNKKQGKPKNAFALLSSSIERGLILLGRGLCKLEWIVEQIVIPFHFKKILQIHQKVVLRQGRQSIVQAIVVFHDTNKSIFCNDQMLQERNVNQLKDLRDAISHVDVTIGRNSRTMWVIVCQHHARCLFEDRFFQHYARRDLSAVDRSNGEKDRIDHFHFIIE